MFKMSCVQTGYRQILLVEKVGGIMQFDDLYCYFLQLPMIENQLVLSDYTLDFPGIFLSIANCYCFSTYFYWALILLIK